MPDRSISDRFAPALIALGIVLVAASWYLRSPRASWPAAALLAVLALVWVVTYSLRRSTNQGSPRRAVDAMQQAIVFAASILVLSLAAKLAADLGLLAGADLARRTGMAITGLFVAFMGNALPKTLTPLSRLQCDPGRVQAFQRFAGWTWVLAGVGYAIAWLVLPLDLARPVSMSLLVSAIVVVLIQMIRLRWTRPRAA